MPHHVQAVHDRHADITDDDVWTKNTGTLEQLASVLHPLQKGGDPRNQPSQRNPESLAIVCQQDCRAHSRPPIEGHHAGRYYAPELTIYAGSAFPGGRGQPRTDTAELGHPRHAPMSFSAQDLSVPAVFASRTQC